MTYYQFMHATAMTLHLNEKTNLFFITNYLNVEDSLIERISDTGIFNSVIKLDQEEGMELYDAAMAKTKGMSEEEIDKVGNSIFDEYLEPYYYPKFKDADFDDEIFVYNDFQRPYYYIANHFNNIVGVEDGYCSIEQQIEGHRFKGKYALVEPFLGKYYPEPLYKHNRITRIISSCNFEELPEYYQERIEVLDFKTLVHEHEQEFMKAQLRVFNLDRIDISSGGILILTTPLSRAKYCTAYESFALYKKLIAEERKTGKKIYIKPHPAEKHVDYKLFEDEQVTVLPKDFPIELLEYSGIRFSKSVSFGSTAIVENLCDRSEVLYSGEVTREHISRFIKKYISNTAIRLNIYIKLTDMHPDKYINAYSFLRDIKGFDTNVCFVVDDNLEEYKEYFDAKHLTARVSEYCKIHKHEGIRYLPDVKLLKKRRSTYKNIQIKKVESSDDFVILNEIISKDSFDFFLLIDDYNCGFTILKRMQTVLRDWIPFCITFYNYTYREEDYRNRVYLGTGRVGDAGTGQIINRIWHKSVIETVDNYDTDSISNAIRERADEVINRPGILMHLDYKRFSELNDPETYYKKRIATAMDKSDSNEEKTHQLAVAAMEYYNWTLVMRPRNTQGLITDILKTNEIDKETACGVGIEIIEQLLTDRKNELKRMIYKNYDDLYYYENIIKKSIHNGKLNHAVMLESALDRIRRKIGR